MFSKTELYAMTSDQIYEAILNGKISPAQFDDWFGEKIIDAREDAYNNGYASCNYDSENY